MKTQKSTVQKNTLFNVVKTFSSILYPLITFPYVSRILMPENVGKVNFGNSIVSYFSLIATLGISTYATRECSKAKKDKILLQQTASEIFSINLISTLIAYVGLIILLVVAKPLSNYRILICIQSTTIIFTTLGADWLNMAMEDFEFIAIRTLSVQIISVVLMLLLVRKQEDYLVYAIISVIASSGANLINIFYRKRYCNLYFIFSKSLARHLVSVVTMFSMTLSQTIYCNSDITMLGLFKGDYEVGLYSTAVKIYNLVNSTVASIVWVVLPGLSEAFSQKKYEEVSKLLKYALNFILVLGLPCVVGINVITQPLLSVIGGHEYVKASISLHILSVSLWFSFLGGWVGNMSMIPAGREKNCLKASIISAITNVAMNFFLIPLFGLNAAATTTAAAECVGFLFLIKRFDKSIKIDGIADMAKAPVMGCIGITLVALITKKIFESDLSVVVFTIAGAIIVYGAVLITLKDKFAMKFFNPIISNLKKGVKK